MVVVGVVVRVGVEREVVVEEREVVGGEWKREEW